MFLLENKQTFVQRVFSIGSLLILLLIGATASTVTASDMSENHPNSNLPDPVVDGHFYDASGNIIEPYSLLYTDPAIGHFYAYLSGSTLYVSVVEDPISSNDNVYDEGNPITPPSSYMASVGWNHNRDAKHLYDSEVLIDISVSCGAIDYTWTQTYMCLPHRKYRQGGLIMGPLQAIQDDGYSFEPDGQGEPRICGNDSGTRPPDYNVASSLAWNYNNTTWEPDQSGATDLGAGDLETAWKSPFDAVNDTPHDFNYPYLSDTYNWEWSMIYEMGFDISACQGEAVTFTIGDVHDSPKKIRFPDPPIIPTVLADLGDLPDSYNTLRASNGAQHPILIDGLRLGDIVDIDFDGQPSVGAIGDDADIADNDEDGVTFLTGNNGTGWGPGTVADGAGGRLQLEINGGSGHPQVFVDFDGNGMFDDNPATGVVLRDAAGVPLVLPLSGTQIVHFDVPNGAYPNAGNNDIGVRVRLSSAGGLTHEGLAEDGEVEDYIYNLSGPTSLTLSEVTIVSDTTVRSAVLVAVFAMLIATMVGYFYSRKEGSM